MFEQTEMLVTYVRARLGLGSAKRVRRSSSTRCIISLVALIAVAGLTFAGTRVSDMFSAIGSKLNVNP